MIFLNCLDRSPHASKPMEMGCNLLSYQVSVLARCVCKSYHLGDNIHLSGKTLWGWHKPESICNKLRHVRLVPATEGHSLWEAMLRGIEFHCWSDLARRLCCGPSSAPSRSTQQIQGHGHSVHMSWTTERSNLCVQSCCNHFWTDSPLMGNSPSSISWITDYTIDNQVISY